MEFKINYTACTFSGRIRIGQFTVEADSIETAKENALRMAIERMEYNEDDDPWSDDVEQIKVYVTEKEVKDE